MQSENLRRYLFYLAPKPASVLFALLLLPLVSLSADNPPTQADLRKLNEAIARVEDQLSSARTERETLQEALFNSEKQISELNSSIETLDTRIAEQRTRLEELNTRSDELETDRQLQQETISRYLRSAWKSGQQEYRKLLLIL
jgi:septal ring factor EnvC (AmiA/AmiB activator)